MVRETTPSEYSLTYWWKQNMISYALMLPTVSSAGSVGSRSFLQNIALEQLVRFQKECC